MTSLVEFAFPSLDVCDVEDMYFRLMGGNGYYSFSKKNIILDAHGRVHFDTYYNSFSISKWKSTTNISNLFFRIEFKGKLALTFVQHRLEHSSIKLYEVILDHDQLNQNTIELSFWSSLESGMLAVEIYSLTPSEISHACYLTSNQPINDVKLGIVVTTFNRQQYVTASIHRLTHDLLTDERFIGKILLFVVDNGQNLEVKTADQVTLIPNPNLGGAGGFTRGLMQLQDCGDYSHCLFMDDDATCEIESIRRTFRFLQYANNTSISVAGAMLCEDCKYIQYENGAKYKNGFLIPINPRLDLRNLRELMINESNSRIDYAGWWFFAFPIHVVTHYAFPFFVKGDDWTFCLKHKLELISMNGISTWQEDFKVKINPFTEYLYFRAFITSALLLDSRVSKYTLGKRFISYIFQNSCAYNYDRARAVCEAISDLLKGPSFWEANVNMAKKRALIREFTLEERPEIIEETENLKVPRLKTRSNFSKFVRQKFLLNGHLIPEFFLKNKRISKLDASNGPSIEGAFRQQAVLYYDYRTRKGYKVTHSKRRFFTNIFFGLVLYVNFIFNFKSLRKTYRAAYPELTSRVFWESCINDTDN